MKSIIFALYVTFVNPQTGEVTKVKVDDRTYQSYLSCHIDKSYYISNEYIFYSCAKIKN